MTRGYTGRVGFTQVKVKRSLTLGSFRAGEPQDTSLCDVNFFLIIIPCVIAIWVAPRGNKTSKHSCRNLRHMEAQSCNNMRFIREFKEESYNG